MVVVGCCSACWWWLRSAYSMSSVSSVLDVGCVSWDRCDTCFYGLRPALRYNLPSNISARSEYDTEKEAKNGTESDELQIELIGENHCLQLGERSKTKVNEKLSTILESLYNRGKLKEGITATGRWYTDNGQKTTRKDIARSSVVAEDVQNLVVRNSKGEIISKGTFYLNKERGYGVINDFELNTTYRKHEQSAGRYNVEPDNKEEQEREMIFKAFQRGVKAFVEKYD